MEGMHAELIVSLTHSLIVSLTHSTPLSASSRLLMKLDPHVERTVLSLERLSLYQIVNMTSDLLYKLMTLQHFDVGIGCRRQHEAFYFATLSSPLHSSC